MNWPGMGDPAKRKQTLKFLIITAAIAISVAAASTAVQTQLNIDNPLKVCINDRYTPYEISATLELYVDGQKANIPANIGFDDGCKRTMHTLADDGKIYATWEEDWPFELGHFLWMWDFPLRDMDESRSSVLVDGKPVNSFIRVPFVDGEQSLCADRDFLPVYPTQNSFYPSVSLFFTSIIKSMLAGFCFLSIHIQL